MPREKKPKIVLLDEETQPKPKRQRKPKIVLIDDETQPKPKRQRKPKKESPDNKETILNKNPWTEFVKAYYSKDKYGSLKNFLQDEEMKSKYQELKGHRAFLLQSRKNKLSYEKNKE